MSGTDDYVERLVAEETQRRAAQLRRGEVGFAAGTPVHTADGLQPIEKIRVGDRVLSCSPSPPCARKRQGVGEEGWGGGHAPGVVPHRVAAISRARTQIVQVVYRPDASDRTRTSFLWCTLNHLFWVVGNGWTEARQLFSGFDVERRLLSNSGVEMLAHRVNLVFITETPGVGWISGFANDRDGRGYEWDFAAGKAGRTDVAAIEDVLYGDDEHLEVEVHEIEVEGSGIFFVGNDGLLVRGVSA